MPAVALTIAGSDVSGGAGIQADLKTFHQFGVYGEAAITLVTVQNTQSVSRVEVLSEDLVREQIAACVSDIPPDAVKTGALGSAAIVYAVADFAASIACPLVIDPVMISKHGAPLLSDDAQEALKRRLFPYAWLVTPNIPEAEILTGMRIACEEEMCIAGRKILDFGCRAVLVKGGHATDHANDLLVERSGCERIAGHRFETRHTHGTGCTYSAAITANMALRRDIKTAIQIAKSYVSAAIETAPGLGKGNGPVNHFAPARTPAEWANTWEPPDRPSRSTR